MAIFSGQIENVYYINPENTDVEIIYSPQEDQHIAHVIQVDFEHPDFKDLLEETSLDQILKNTSKRLKEQSDIFGVAVTNVVDQYMETEFKERKLEIEKDLEEFRTNWIAEREKYYAEIYGDSLEQQHKLIEKEREEITKEWDQLKEVWKKADVSSVESKRVWKEIDKSWKVANVAEKEITKLQKDLEKKHKGTLKNLEKVAKNFEEFIQEQAEKFKSHFDVDSNKSKEEVEEQYRQMIEHYDMLKKQTDDLKISIGFNYPNYIDDLLKRTTSQVLQGQESKNIADAIVKDIIQSNTIASLAAHKKIDSNLLTVVLDNESEAAKEELFKLKLAIFEMEEVKENKNKEQKAKIRKAPTKLRVLVEFDKLNV
jgi:hypothetical protein